VQRRTWFARQFSHDDTPDAFPDIIERLRGTPLRLRERTTGPTEELLCRRVEGSWSIQEHAGHLADIESLWFGRLDDFDGRAPELRSADLKNRATWDAHHNDRSIDDIAREFTGRRARFVERLSGLTAADVAVTSLHPRLQQPMSVLDHCFFVAEHDDHHRAAITELRTLLGA
jgi:uncharacterized damage-inducible protein DinB